MNIFAKISQPGLLAPPSGFAPVENVCFVEEDMKPPMRDGKRKSGAQKAGLRYQGQVEKIVRSEFTGFKVRCAPWLRFVDGRVRRACEPDIVIEMREAVLVIETKISHCELAWWQLRRLYEPVVSKWLKKPVVCAEITRSYDPDVVWPEATVLVSEWADFKRAIANAFRAQHAPMLIMQWRGDNVRARASKSKVVTV